MKLAQGEEKCEKVYTVNSIDRIGKTKITLQWPKKYHPMS